MIVNSIYVSYKQNTHTQRKRKKIIKQYNNCAQSSNDCFILFFAVLLKCPLKTIEHLISHSFFFLEKSLMFVVVVLPVVGPFHERLYFYFFIKVTTAARVSKKWPYIFCFRSRNDSSL
jgi:hypothetical protein